MEVSVTEHWLPLKPLAIVEISEISKMCPVFGENVTGLLESTKNNTGRLWTESDDYKLPFTSSLNGIGLCVRSVCNMGMQWKVKRSRKSADKLTIIDVYTDSMGIKWFQVKTSSHAQLHRPHAVLFHIQDVDFPRVIRERWHAWIFQTLRIKIMDLGWVVFLKIYIQMKQVKLPYTSLYMIIKQDNPDGYHGLHKSYSKMPPLLIYSSFFYIY